MNAMLEQRLLKLIHQMDDEQLSQVIHFIEEQSPQPKKGLGTLLHEQFKAAGLVNAGFESPERPIEAERVAF
jgi:hypothetical protein